MKVLVVVLAAIAGLSAARAEELDARVDFIIARFEGEYTGTFPGLFAGEPNTPSVKMWAAVKRVELPQFSARAVYMEMRRDGPQGKIARQRIFAFNDDADRERNWALSYDFPDGAPYAGAHKNPGVLAALNPQDMRLFPEGCELHAFVEGDAFTLTAHKETCRIVNRESSAPRYVTLQFVIKDDGFTMAEQGFDDDGKFLFGTPEPVRYTKMRR
jgi:hypothetical protein